MNAAQMANATNARNLFDALVKADVTERVAGSAHTLFLLRLASTVRVEKGTTR